MTITTLDVSFSITLYPSTAVYIKNPQKIDNINPLYQALSNLGTVASFAYSDKSPKLAKFNNRPKKIIPILLPKIIVKIFLTLFFL